MYGATQTMMHGSMSRALKGIRQLAQVGRRSELTDRQLIEHFVSQQDEAAFTELVRRYGPMVLGVCRRVLRNEHDAEDALQATFLVLVRKASTIRRHDSARGWLFQVAYRLALQMRTNARRECTCVLPEIAALDREAGHATWELRWILDEELSRLPEKYRAVLLLCLCEGNTRAEAARQLGWKTGAVKIRLERGRALLRDRLTRRGFALSGLLLGSWLADSTVAAVPPLLIRNTVASSQAFALGVPIEAVGSASGVALAQGALKAMMMKRLRVVVLLVVSVTAALVGAGLGAYRGLAKAPESLAPGWPQSERAPSREQQAEKPAVPPVVKEPKKLVRVLLFADAPSREYQFLRAFFVQQMDRRQLELTIHLQAGGGRVVQDLPPERMLKQFPTRLDSREKKEDSQDIHGNLASYDVVIALDPDWTKLSKQQRRLLEEWVAKEGRALIFVAGVVHTFKLAHPVAAPEFKPILDVLPVQLEDIRVVEARATNKPWPLRIPGPEEFLKLEAQGNEGLAGWSDFFFDKRRRDWQDTEDQPMRGFYSAYPIKKVKPAAKVLATFRDPNARIVGDQAMPQELPFIVKMNYGKGKSIYLGSGEFWRLRQYNTAFYERFWSELARYAASPEAAPARKAGASAPKLNPDERKAINAGLKWLAWAQHRDGHWASNQEDCTFMMTALAGMALLMQGSTISEGEYAWNVRKAVDWLMMRTQKNGRIGNPDDKLGDEKYMDGHGYALLFLASIYGEEEDPERRVRLQRILRRAVDFTVDAQTSAGGWGCLYQGMNKEGDDQADLAPTLVQLRALRAARGAGISVPKGAGMARPLAYLQKQRRFIQIRRLRWPGTTGATLTSASASTTKASPT
jgi:RNA polymerase sigma factor (sigma-70 family)